MSILCFGEGKSMYVCVILEEWKPPKSHISSQPLKVEEVATNTPSMASLPTNARGLGA